MEQVIDGLVEVDNIEGFRSWGVCGGQNQMFLVATPPLLKQDELYLIQWSEM